VSDGGLTPRARVEKALHGGHTDVVPFTVYEYKLIQCERERQLRNRGLCSVERRVHVCRSHRPNCRMTQEVTWEDDRRFTRTHYETPVGRLSGLSEAADFTAWHHEKMFKTADDYKAILALIRDERFEPDPRDVRRVLHPPLQRGR